MSLKKDASNSGFKKCARRIDFTALYKEKSLELNKKVKFVRINTDVIELPRSVLNKLGSLTVLFHFLKFQKNV